MEVTPEMMCRMTGVVDWNDPNEVTVWAAMCLCYYATLRKDNVTVGKQDAFNPRENITNGDVALDTRTLQGSVNIRHSKTNTAGERQHVIPLLGYGGKVCVVTSLATMLKITVGASRTEKSPLFQIKKGAKWVPMTRTYFVDKFKEFAKKAGYNPDLYAGHSFRRGSGTRSFKLNCRTELIKWQGDWQSDAYQRYITLDMEQRLIVPTALTRDMEEHEKQMLDRLAKGA